jgi:putative PIN family toxin of toxin-antitoxin system
MISAVVDTNVLVSALMNSEGASAAILKQRLLGKFRWYLSPELLGEYSKVLPRPRLKFDQHQVSRLLRLLQRKAVLVKPHQQIQVATDPDDDMVIECALAARADFIVSGNIRHFPSQFQDIRVVTPRKFIEVLASDPYSS